MSNPFLGEIRMFGGNFAPQGWAFCNGQIVSIAENSALFSLIGTTYGGDGQNTFALPNLQSRVPVHMGTNPSSGGTFVQGQLGGEENVTLLANQVAAHNHLAQADPNAGGQTSPAGNAWANSSATPYATPDTIDTQMLGNALQPAGNSLPHDNMIPFLAIHFIIALVGIFPSRN